MHEWFLQIEVTVKTTTTLANLGTYRYTIYLIIRSRSSRTAWPLWECSNSTARAILSSSSHDRPTVTTALHPLEVFFFPGGSLAHSQLFLVFSFGSFFAGPCPKIYCSHPPHPNQQLATNNQQPISLPSLIRFLGANLN